MPIERTAVLSCIALAASAACLALLGCGEPVPATAHGPAAVPGAAEPVAPATAEAPPAIPLVAEAAPASVAAREAASPAAPAPPAPPAPPAAAAAAAPDEDRPAAPPRPAQDAADVYPVKPGEWPMWGGSPSRNMANDREKGIPHTWDLKSKKNIKWVAALGSQSYGNPVIAGGRILVGTNNQLERNPKIQGDKGVVMCFREADGTFLWQAVHDKLESGRVNDWPEQGICSAACVEGDRFYYVSNRAELVCADLEGFQDGENDGPFKSEKYHDPIDGDFIWVLDMMEDLAVFPHNLATCSPLLVNDLVYVITSNGVEKDHITIPSPRAPSFIAVNKRTGELVWESSAPGEKIIHGQWSAPSYILAGGRPQVIFPGGDGWVRAFEPLKGGLIWEFDCNPKDAVYDLGGRGTRNEIIATSVCDGGRVYVAVGQDPEHGEGIGHFYSIDASKQGDVTAAARVWHYGDKEFRRTISTCAVKDGLVYAADLSGFLHCLDLETGRPYWVHDTLAAVWGSPAWIDGKVFLGDEDGDVVVVKAGKKLEVLAEINMDNSVYSTPVAAKGVLYIMNRTSLFAIAETGGGPDGSPKGAGAPGEAGKGEGKRGDGSP
ncbi:MAG: PQQ-binding-like beta-propeller repeat protein [Planctomycetes bacterium]|nr:PQQ-binding-like beta-propeller repeat protein [Planctomycetota bacterium]